MSLDNIQLTPLLLQQLYQKSLVDLDDHQQPKSTEANPATASIPRLGNNEKKILVLVKDETAAFLNDTDFASLVKILSACQLSPADIALVNYSNNAGINFTQLNNTFTPLFIVLLGVTPSELEFPLLFPHYQLTKYNGQTYLASPSLTQMGNDVASKKEFWNAFKKYFSS
jgi:hypothetical protein